MNSENNISVAPYFTQGGGTYGGYGGRIQESWAIHATANPAAIRAAALIEQRDYAGALRVLQEALARNPLDVDLLFQSGRAYEKVRGVKVVTVLRALENTQFYDFWGGGNFYSFF